MPQDPHPLHAFVRKIEHHSQLTAAEQDAILSLPCSIRNFPPNRHMVREGSAVDGCYVLMSGYAFRSKIAGTGARQIMAVHVKGDAVDLQNAVLPWADHDVHALNQVEAAYIQIDAIHAMMAQHPGAARAIWRDTLIDGAVEREWVVNVGRRDAVARVAHLFCELVTRQEAAGLGRSGAYDMPLTQEAIGDCTGLTSVHVNRMLQRMRSEGLITLRGRELRVEDWDRLTRVADFQPEYLFVEANARQVA